MRKLLATSLSFVTILFSVVLAEETPAETALPKVLIIGDSISIGFTPHVVEQLDGKAVVKHHKGNAQHTGTGLKQLDQWIGNTKWDVIPVSYTHLTLPTKRIV